VDTDFPCDKTSMFLDKIKETAPITSYRTLFVCEMVQTIAQSFYKNSFNINPRLSFILSEDNPILSRKDAMNHTHKFYELNDVHSGNRHDVRT
jgi:hypothetical protein